MFELLEEHADLDAYLVGGVPRDVALGRVSDPKDFDFILRGPAVGAALDAMSRAGDVRLGPFGSPRWFPEGAEIYCDVMPVDWFFNGLWRCEDIVDALNQFDFTGNA